MVDSHHSNLLNADQKKHAIFENYFHMSVRFKLIRCVGKKILEQPNHLADITK